MFQEPRADLIDDITWKKKAKADAIDSDILRSNFMQCEESRNHKPFLEHIGDNTNCRNTVDKGLKFNLFLS